MSIFNLLSLPLRAIPNSLHSALASPIVNFTMSLAQADLSQLEGKVITLRLIDTGIEFTFLIRNSIITRAVSGAWDVRISGKTADYFALLTASEDPDTLFFNRRLAMEGDTAAALFIKNTLDSIEWESAIHDLIQSKSKKIVSTTFNNLRRLNNSLSH